MVVDEAGALWLADPWLALMTMVLAVALVVWCHRWLESGRAPRPRSMAVLARRARGRRASTATGRSGAALAAGRLTVLSGPGQPARLRHAPRPPRSAA